ncbi:MAG: J domain-containing protein [Gemmatimonadaceae bacterium]|nr:J domain-containing protein [Gemmatimonadaceae bacterium]
MAPQKDFYAVLGVSASATADELKKHYRRLAKQFHPDSNKGDAKASERFKEISEAYTVLGDEKKRKQYDEMRRLGAFSGGFGGASRSGGSTRPNTGGAGARRPSGAAGAGGNYEYPDFDVGGLGGLGDLFSSMFGGGRQRPTGPENGQTVETSLEVPFRTAVLGGKVTIDLEVNEECATCAGSGAARGAKLQPCPECAGRGTISFGQGSFATVRPCPMCLGKGTVPTEKCGTCNGAGEQRSKRKVNITVPSGTESGGKIRLKGQGGRGVRGGAPGDLLITFRVKDDPEWERDGTDLITRAAVNIVQATLGSKVTVETLHDKKVTIAIPAGTPSGKRFRVRGQGVAKDGKAGDLLVEIAVQVPSTLTPEQTRLLKEFAAAAGLSY